MRENSEAIVLSSDISERNLAILRKIFTAGLTVLKDAIQYDERDDIADISTQLPNGKQSMSSEAILDNGGGDITELNGNLLNNSSRQVLAEFDDGDDLTTLNGPKQNQATSKIILHQV